MQLQIILVCFCLSSVEGVLRFASYYQDHMVLQRGPQQAVVWGYATIIGDTVTVDVSGHESITGQVTLGTNRKGIWRFKLPAITNKGPFTLTASSSEGTVSIHDILFGDVWICSGQSNMDFPVESVVNSPQEVAASLQYTDIRFMTVKRLESEVALTDLPRGSAINWTQPTPAAVKAFSAVCWFFGVYLNSDVNYPIGLIQSSVSSTPIEAWSSPDALAECGRTRNSGLWNAMLNPLTGMTIYGAIWYQGESNRRNPVLYACQFPAMINDWRTKFHKASLGETSAEFPFGFVQLAAFRNDRPRIVGFPSVRWAQTANQGEVPNDLMKRVFMAVAMDHPDFVTAPRGSIHPYNKQNVSKRLETAALAVAYGNTTVKYRGPFPKTITENKLDRTVHIVYDHGPIEVRDDSGFEVCCSLWTSCGPRDSWVAAPIETHQSSGVFISTSACDNLHAVGVRYAWRETPCDYEQCAIYGRESSLPAPPYIQTEGIPAESADNGNGATVDATSPPVRPRSDPVIYFKAYSKTKQTVSKGATLRFDNVVADIGHGYNPRSGVFTAPVSGIYMLTVILGSIGSGSGDFAIRNEGQVEAYITIEDGYDVGPMTTLAHVTKGHNVFVTRTYGGPKTLREWRLTQFSGFLLRAD